MTTYQKLWRRPRRSETQAATRRKSKNAPFSFKWIDPAQIQKCKRYIQQIIRGHKCYIEYDHISVGTRHLKHPFQRSDISVNIGWVFTTGKFVRVVFTPALNLTTEIPSVNKSRSKSIREKHFHLDPFLAYSSFICICGTEIRAGCRHGSSGIPKESQKNPNRTVNICSPSRSEGEICGLLCNGSEEMRWRRRPLHWTPFPQLVVSLSQFVLHELISRNFPYHALVLKNGGNALAIG